MEIGFCKNANMLNQIRPKRLPLPIPGSFSPVMIRVLSGDPSGRRLNISLHRTGIGIMYRVYHR